jgi:hypothetical protein
MAIFPDYDFTDIGLNYETVEESLKDLVSYIDVNQTIICCPAKAVRDAMNIVTPKLMAMEINKEKDNTEAYQLDVKVSYSLLYPFVS